MNSLNDIFYYLDEPTSDPAAISLYFVAKLASNDVKVVLSGEGADEFFGGYNIYRYDVDLGIYNKLPYFIRHFFSNIAKLLPEFKGINFLIRRGEKPENYYIGVNRNFSEKMARKVLKEKYPLKGIDVAKEVYQEYSEFSDINKMQAIDINYWLMKDILLKADRMTMASSLEGRVPFIDKEVFNVAKTLPIEYKVTKENTKVALIPVGYMDGVNIETGRDMFRWIDKLRYIVRDIKEPIDVLTTLSSLNLQILLYSKQASDRTMFLKHARAKEISMVLTKYFTDYDLTNCLKLLQLIKADLIATEYISGRRNEEL